MAPLLCLSSRVKRPKYCKQYSQDVHSLQSFDHLSCHPLKLLQHPFWGMATRASHCITDIIMPLIYMCTLWYRHLRFQYFIIPNLLLDHCTVDARWVSIFIELFTVIKDLFPYQPLLALIPLVCVIFLICLHKETCQFPKKCMEYVFQRIDLKAEKEGYPPFLTSNNVAQIIRENDEYWNGYANWK